MGTYNKRKTMKNIHTFDEFLNESVRFDKRSLKQKLETKVPIAKKAAEKWESQVYQDNLAKAEKAAKTGVLPGSYDSPWLVQGEDRKEDGFELFNGRNALALAEEVGKIIQKYKKDEVASSSVPAAGGWSGTMRSTVGGSIEPRVNFNNGKNNFLIAVTVGGGISSSVRQQIFTELYPIFFMFDEYNGSNGGIMVSYDSGTNYDTFGLKCSFSRFNPGFAGQIIKSLS
jgi:hypothetical protein